MVRLTRFVIQPRNIADLIKAPELDHVYVYL